MKSIGDLFEALPSEIAHNITIGFGEYVEFGPRDLMVYLSEGSGQRTRPTREEENYENLIGGIGTGDSPTYWNRKTGYRPVRASSYVEAVRTIWNERFR
jgi:hypothetical protein